MIFVSWCSSIMTEIYLVYGTDIIRSAVRVSFHLVPLSFCQDAAGKKKKKKKKKKNSNISELTEQRYISQSFYVSTGRGLLPNIISWKPTLMGTVSWNISKSSLNGKWRVTTCFMKSSTFKWQILLIPWAKGSQRPHPTSKESRRITKHCSNREENQNYCE